MWDRNGTVTGTRWPASEVWSCHSKLCVSSNKLPTHAKPKEETVGIEDRNESLGRDIVSHMAGDTRHVVVIILIIIVTVLSHFHIFRDMERTTKFSPHS